MRKVYLSQVWDQRVEIMHQRGDPQNQPEAGPEAKVRESASHHMDFLFKIYYFCIEMRFCWSWNAPKLIWKHFQKSAKFQLFIKILTFFDTCPDQFESSRCPIEIKLR